MRCLEGNETDYIERYQKMTKGEEIKEIIYFEYQRMMRYGGSWHLENKIFLPGYICVSGTGKTVSRMYREQGRNAEDAEKQIEGKATQVKEVVLLNSYEISWLKALCTEGNLIDMSRGIIKNGFPVVTEGPLKGQEHLIKKIDRHKRVAEIEMPFEGRTIRAVIGLEIYRKETGLRKKQD